MYLHINIQNVCNAMVVYIMSNILYPLSFIFYQSSTTIPMKGSFIKECKNNHLMWVISDLDHS